VYRTTRLRLTKDEGWGVVFDSSDLRRFIAKVEAGDGCWLWTSQRTPEGYGQFHFGRRGTPPWYAHRLAWELSNGPIPDGLSVLHHCDTPSCVNPQHLFLGTQTDNMQDASRKGRLNGRYGLAGRRRKVEAA
jgi:hypothetical protein